MNLKELFEYLYDVVNYQLDEGDDWEQFNVVVTTSEPSLGARSKSNVKAMFRGIDWEHNQIRIETEDDLVKVKQESKSKDD